MKKFLLIDAHALAYRAFYAFPISLTLKNGQPVNTIYGFLSLTLSAIDKFKPDYLAICFDRKEPTFRHQVFPQYKAHRPPTPVEFISQIELLKKSLQDLGLPIFETPGFEADDLLGTLSLEGEKNNLESLILTGDRDVLQLVSDKTKAVLVQKGLSHLITIDLPEFEKTYKFTPKEFIDLKALQGDTSDNIPGVPGIGEKTAFKLMEEFKNLDNLYKNIDTVKPAGVQKKLQENKDQAYLSYHLAEIKRDVPVAFDLNAVALNFDWQRAYRLFKDFEFSSLIKKYEAHFQHTGEDTEVQGITAPDGKYVAIDSIEKLKGFIPTLKKGFSFDLETTSTDALTASLIGISFAVQEKEAFYVPIQTRDTQNQFNEFPLFSQEINLDSQNQAMALLKPIFENNEIPKYTHNGKYDYLVLRQAGITVKNITFDTMLAAYLVYPLDRFGLKDLSLRLLNTKMTTFDELTNKNQIRLLDLPEEKLLNYAAADADYTFRLMNYFKPLIEEKDLTYLFYEIEIPLQIVLAEMENAGINIDLTYLNSLKHDFCKELLELRKKIIEDVGFEFNINSPKQLSEVLFKHLKLPVFKKTKEGFSTNAQVLEKLAYIHPLPKLLLKYRNFEKLINTYLNSLPELLNKNTRRIHTSFNQTGTITGRLSSSKPNLQNIPIKGIEGQKIRRVFVPNNPENFILSADYSQIELRILAHYAKDEALIKAFQNNEDIHASTAALIFNTELDSVTKEQRQAAKAINFGIVYGISAFSLSEHLGLNPKEAKKIIDDYFHKFHSIKEFIDATIKETDINKYVRTYFGRIRPIPDIIATNKSKRQFAERTAINTIIQGTAADIIKLAMINIAKRLKDEGLKSQMLIQVHDELVFETDHTEVEQLTKLVKFEMENAVKLTVPLTVDTEVGKNWHEVS